MRRKARSRTLRVDRHLGRDRPSGASRFESNLGQGQRLEAAGVGAGENTLPPLTANFLCCVSCLTHETQQYRYSYGNPIALQGWGWENDL